MATPKRIDIAIRAGERLIRALYLK